MNAVDRLVGYFSPSAALRRAGARQQLAGATRSYDAARPSRATAGWRRPATSARSETYTALRDLRAGSHDTVRNNPNGAKIISSLAVDIVGTGIQPRADTGNKALNRKVDALAKRFFRRMSVDEAVKSYGGYQLLAARSFLESGEAVHRRLVRPMRLGLPVPLQFSLMESEFIDNTRNWGEIDGNPVIQGVEFDQDTRQRAFYHMFRDHPGDSYVAASAGSSTIDRIPAADVRVTMEPQRPNQVRGVPWLTPILVRAKLLDDYEDAERQRKRTESSVPLVVQGGNQLGDASDNAGPSLFPTLTDADGRIVEVVTPGLVAYGRDSTKIEALKPVDAMGYGPYKRTELQSIAAGARSTYELTSGDLSQTNFSSFQAGHLPYRAMVDAVREHILIPDLEWIWECFIDVSILMGLLPDGTPVDVKHHCPPWLPIDPVKQAEADKIAIRTGTKTLYGVITAGGRDFEEHVAEIKMSNKLLDKYDLILDSDPRRTDLRGVEQQQEAGAGKAKGPAPPSSGDDPDKA